MIPPTSSAEMARWLIELIDILEMKQWKRAANVLCMLHPFDIEDVEIPPDEWRSMIGNVLRRYPNGRKSLMRYYYQDIKTHEICAESEYAEKIYNWLKTVWIVYKGPDNVRAVAP